MKICIYNAYEQYNQHDSIFDPAAYSLGDGLEIPFIALRQELQGRGHSLETIDQRSVEEFDLFIFIDFPNSNPDLIKKLHLLGKRLFLVIMECALMNASSFNSENLKYFEKVFTYYKKENDDPRFIHSVIPYGAVLKTGKRLAFHEKKLTVAIISNKNKKNPGLLYSERMKALRWFQQNAPEDIDLFGRGWGLHTFTGNRIIRSFNHIGFLRKMRTTVYSFFRGEIDKKHSVLKQYKFCICYENASIPGYITEKIFDCFYAGCIPIYLGAPDIQEYIPKACFIDKRDFPTYNGLYRVLISMSEKEYLEKLSEIDKYINNFENTYFSVSSFSKRIANEITQ